MHLLLPLLILSTGLVACQRAEPAQEPAAPPAVADTRPAAAPVAAPPPAMPASGDVPGPSPAYHYTCGDAKVTATFTPEAATLDIDGRALVLPRAESGSGAKYMDSAGNTFWTKGEREGMLTLAGAPEVSCTAGA